MREFDFRFVSSMLNITQVKKKSKKLRIYAFIKFEAFIYEDSTIIWGIS